MRVLLTGANGFIGRYLLAALLRAGHEVVPAVRDTAAADRLLPAPASLHADFNTDTDPAVWLPRLRGIDAVINCAGILSGRWNQSIEAIHANAPMALFSACEKAGVRRVVQISAISAEEKAGTAYARTKRSADKFLAATSLDWIVVRPSLVYAEGAYGGTALFRALAAMPFAIPVVGAGDQLFQPIHIDDLSQLIVQSLASSSLNRIVVDPVGPDRLSLGEILTDLRRWLGFEEAPLLRIPVPVIRLAARLGDVTGGTINTTALKQLLHGNTGDAATFARVTGIAPRRWREALHARPSQTQDRWHARLYFLRPLLRWLVGLTWIASGIIGLLRPIPLENHFAVLDVTLPFTAFRAACAADMAIGAAVIARWKYRLMAAIQLGFVAAYTLALTMSAPVLWLDPFGPLLKNFVFAAAVLVLAAIEPDR